jgi:hypothetical protein
MHLLLPEGIFPDDECADALSNQQVDDHFGSPMQQVLDAAIALVCDGIQMSGGEAVLLGQVKVFGNSMVRMGKLRPSSWVMNPF